MVDERGCPSGARPALPLDGVTNSRAPAGRTPVPTSPERPGRLRAAIDSPGFHPPRRPEPGWVRIPAAGAYIQERIQQRRAIGQAQIEKDGVERVRGAGNPRRRRADRPARYWRFASCTTGDSLRSRATLRTAAVRLRGSSSTSRSLRVLESGTRGSARRSGFVSGFDDPSR